MTNNDKDYLKPILEFVSKEQPTEIFLTYFDGMLIQLDKEDHRYGNN